MSRLFPKLVMSLSIVFSSAVIGGSDVPAGAAKNPEQASKTLYSAWQSGSRRLAGTVADRKAVTKLFGINRQKLLFNGCNNRDEGGWQCVYADKDHDFSVAFEVDGGASLGFYRITSVSFSTEAQ